ncbi:MAG: hypothetical protein JXR12_15280 [Neptunomonas phycophila]|uniref:hypothetical protein n=1 Tax=Neptunomonas phycophila TaxID=1572645 RepID=UPI003B8C30C4
MSENQYKKEVYCTLQFEAVHNWPGCPIEEVAYLRDPHRHTFHIKAHANVSHNDRDVEFIELKHKIVNYLREKYPSDVGCPDIGATSCEMLAQELIEEFDLSRCEVNEDNENGAVLTVLEDQSVAALTPPSKTKKSWLGKLNPLKKSSNA